MKHKKRGRRRKQDDRSIVQNDAEFANRIKRLADKIEGSQLEIGRLVQLYIDEQGNRYGDGVFKHIAEITGLSKRSIHHYHDYYCLQTEYGNHANLHNLGRSSQYEIARLSKHPDAKTLIPQVAQKAIEESMTTDEVEKCVAEIINNSDTGKHRKPKPEEPAATAPSAKPKGNDNDSSASNAKADENILNQASAEPEQAAKQETKLAEDDIFPATIEVSRVPMLAIRVNSHSSGIDIYGEQSPDNMATHANTSAQTRFAAKALFSFLKEVVNYSTNEQDRAAISHFLILPIGYCKHVIDLSFEMKGVKKNTITYKMVDTTYEFDKVLTYLADTGRLQYTNQSSATPE